MKESGVWIWSGLVGVMGVIALYVASRGGDNPVAYWGGLAFFALGVLFIFWQIKRGFDHAQNAHH